MRELGSFDNYRDLSRPAATGAGFQFEFLCECCGDAWRTTHKPYRQIRMPAWLSRAAGTCGDMAARLGRTVEAYTRAVRRAARKAALSEAVDQARWHFRHCSACSRCVCARCSGGAGMCVICSATSGIAPVLRVHRANRDMSDVVMVNGVARADDNRSNCSFSYLSEREFQF